MSELWLTIEADRALYADRGRDVILCDRLASPITLVVRVNEISAAALRRQLNANAPPTGSEA